MLSQDNATYRNKKQRKSLGGPRNHSKEKRAVPLSWWESSASRENEGLQFSLLPLYSQLKKRRKWQPTPVFLPGESQGWGSLVGCRLWGCTELDTTEAT